MRADRHSLRAEIEEILQSMPPRATIRHRDNPDNVHWFGRVCAAISKWNPSKSALAQECIVDAFLSQCTLRRIPFANRGAHPAKPMNVIGVVAMADSGPRRHALQYLFDFSSQRMSVGAHDHLGS